MSYVEIESKKIKDDEGDTFDIAALDGLVEVGFTTLSGAGTYLYSHFKPKHIRRLIEALEEAEAHAANYIADTTF